MLEKMKLSCRKADSSDIPLMKKWLKNGEFVMNFYSLPRDDDKALETKVRSMLKEASRDLADKKYLIAESDRPIGMIMLHDIDWRNRNLSLDILIGDDELKNKIWGVKIFAEAIRVIFEVLNMHKFYGMIYEFNGRSARLVEAFGGRKEGVYKRYVERDGKRHDAAVYAMFKRDYPAFLELLKKY